MTIARAYGHRAIFLFQNDQLKPCILHTIGVRCPYGDRAMLLRRVYGLTIFNFLYNAELIEIVEVTATPTTPPKKRTISYGLCTETAPKWEFRHRTIALSSSQAKCKLDLSLFHISLTAALHISATTNFLVSCGSLMVL